MKAGYTTSGFWTGLTGLLAGTSLFLAALLLLQTLLLGRPGEIQVEPDPLPEVDTELRQVALNDEDIQAYSSITQRPLFFPDRTLPVIETETVAGTDEGPVEVEVNELDARLAGVIITPDRKIAMITDGKTDKTTVMREGMSLEGEQAAWQLSAIGERSVSFAAGERSAELELKVNKRSLQAPASSAVQNNRAVNNNSSNNAAIQAATSNAAANSAAEVRRRIAERRAKLRAARERQAQQQAEEEN